MNGQVINGMNELRTKVVSLQDGLVRTGPKGKRLVRRAISLLEKYIANKVLGFDKIHMTRLRILFMIMVLGFDNLEPANKGEFGHMIILAIEERANR
jgi:hypothetical protein